MNEMQDDQNSNKRQKISNDVSNNVHQALNSPSKPNERINNYDYKSKPRIIAFLLIWNVCFTVMLVGLIGVCIYLLTVLPVSSSQRGLGKTLGVIGTVVSFIPMFGLVLKYSTKLVTKKHYDETSKVMAWINLLFRITLFWERKTRLVMAWCAIFLIVGHLIILGSLVNQDLGSSKYQWNLATILGLIAMGFLIVMNFNGIVMIIMRSKKFKLEKIKYLGMTNLGLGLTFFVLVIVHIILLG